jgi:hypothetical protein
MYLSNKVSIKNCTPTPLAADGAAYHLVGFARQGTLTFAGPRDFFVVNLRKQFDRFILGNMDNFNNRRGNLVNLRPSPAGWRTFSLSFFQVMISGLIMTLKCTRQVKY